MKKIICIALVAFAAVAFTGCKKTAVDQLKEDMEAILQEVKDTKNAVDGVKLENKLRTLMIDAEKKLSAEELASMKDWGEDFLARYKKAWEEKFK